MELGKYFTPLCVFGCTCKIKSNWKFWILTVKFAPQLVKWITGLIYLQITFSKLTPREREKEDLSSLMRSPSRARRGYSADPSLIFTDPSLVLVLTNPPLLTHLPPFFFLKTHLLSFPSRSGILWGSYSVFLFCLHDLVEVVTIICSWLQLICFCWDLLVLGKVFDKFLENVLHAKPNTGNTFSGVFYRTTK